MKVTYTVWEDEPGRDAGASVQIRRDAEPYGASWLIKDPNVALKVVEILNTPGVDNDLHQLKNLFDHAYMAKQIEWALLPPYEYEPGEGPCVFCGEPTRQRLNVSPIGEEFVCNDCEDRDD